MAECTSPYLVRNKVRTLTNDQDTIPVPCGKCPNCINRRSSGWSFRLMEEDKKAVSSSFITLTYDSKFVPLTSNGFMGLRKRDLQLFFKRLRFAQDRYNKLYQAQGKNVQPIKYYACGEYGGKTKRPHYHIILFNAKLELIQDAWIDAKSRTHLGQVHYGTVSGASVGYTLKYLQKRKRIPEHGRDDREKEFALMSKGLARLTSVSPSE